MCLHVSEMIQGTQLIEGTEFSCFTKEMKALRVYDPCTETEECPP